MNILDMIYPPSRFVQEMTAQGEFFAQLRVLVSQDNFYSEADYLNAFLDQVKMGMTPGMLRFAAKQVVGDAMKPTELDRIGNALGEFGRTYPGKPSKFTNRAERRRKK